MNEPTLTLLKSRICTQEQLESKTFQDWAERLGEARGNLHRKIWEWCFITQALHERNLLKAGASGLGFAVGKEPLASLFCSYGASICATDLFTDIAQEQGWVDTNEHASTIKALNTRKLCSDAQFKKNCTFQHADMNAIPKDLNSFDFVWSSCALEHLGSLSHGEEFIYNSMNCLKPGGFAVHTTEYNFSSNNSTLSSGITVLYRRQDIEKIIHNIRKEGHSIDIDFAGGTLPSDIFIDLPPYKQNPHIKLQIGEYTVTSIGLIIQKQQTT